MIVDPGLADDLPALTVILWPFLGVESDNVSRGVGGSACWTVPGTCACRYW